MAVTDVHAETQAAVVEAPRGDLSLVPELSGSLAVDAAVRDLGAPVSHDAYHLSPEQMDALEAELYEEVREQFGDRPIGVVVVSPESRYADFGRTSETGAYKGYDNHAAMAPYERQSFFLFTYDNESGAIAHVKRIVRAKTPEEAQETGLTGLEIIDDRLTATVPEEAAELDDILAFHNIEDTATVWNVAANHNMYREGTVAGRPYTETSYSALFELTRQQGVNSILAYLNPAAIKSLITKAGLESSLLGGREYHLPNTPDPEHPEVEVEPYDEEYTAVCIQDSEHNVATFAAVKLFIPETDAPIVHVS